jgi:hypothetical protein
MDGEYMWTGQTENSLLAEVINDYFGTGTLDPKKYSGLTEDGFVNRNATVAEMKEILTGIDVDYIRDGNNVILLWSE